MPIVIWGSRGLTSRLDSGRFYCPHCDDEEKYQLKQVRPWFTLYFIPLFPIGGAERYVECGGCGGTYKDAVLDEPAPSEGDRLTRQIWNDLKDGGSVEDAEQKLVKMGMSRDQAENIVSEMAGDGTWSCNGCNQNYLKSVRKCRTCRNA